MEQRFIDQVELMLQCLPAVMEQDVFALKGGTAINFFYRNLPRLSVDIDLTYLPVKPREESLANISYCLDVIGSKLRSPGIRVEKKQTERHITKLMVFGNNALVKIEPNTIIRGSVFPAKPKSIAPNAESQFEAFLEVKCLDEDELYAGKICAALDRQHPRDLFDMLHFYQDHAITPRLANVLAVYIASSPRPMHEMLAPNRLDINPAFTSEFVGMATAPVTIEELENIRERLITDVSAALTEEGARFLLSLCSGKPNLDFLAEHNIKQLPAIQWKLLNIQKMDDGKRQQQFESLAKILTKP